MPDYIHSCQIRTLQPVRDIEVKKEKNLSELYVFFFQMQQYSNTALPMKTPWNGLYVN